ncbi:MAG: BrnA antitoxin family protein [Pyrinomonadaceae bacterium]|nr:BrnA antitoxin family protein [Pyrinomonadaceae bacterium]
MNKTDAESKLKFLETSEEEKAHGLRRIKRRHITKPGEMTLENCWVEISLSLDAEVLQFFESDSAKINAVLRKEMEKRKLSNELLEDTEFVSRLREKLAA